jgi:hypothetical protein
MAAFSIKFMRGPHNKYFVWEAGMLEEYQNWGIGHVLARKAKKGEKFSSAGRAGLTARHKNTPKPMPLVTTTTTKNWGKFTSYQWQRLHQKTSRTRIRMTSRLNTSSIVECTILAQFKGFLPSLLLRGRTNWHKVA